jgi:hypothetical protein
MIELFGTRKSQIEPSSLNESTVSPSLIVCPFLGKDSNFRDHLIVFGLEDSIEYFRIQV